MAQVRAVLGPTNTGKTHLAIERMLGHQSGMIGLPLRLLAREVYDRIVKQKGARACALITGEERIEPDTARYFVATVEAMPLSRPVEFLCVDEVQLAADPDRGHLFTDRLLHARGTHETLFIGSETMRPALNRLGIVDDITYRERLSKLTYGGAMKITRLPRRTAVVAFSAEEVYAIAELLRRHRGGAAVVMGALSPRTRNAQVALYQTGEVDYLVATDAIGMGLNMDVDHVAFASRAKFDGRRRRKLRADEIAQIAGRAGRFVRDGSFGETTDCEPFDPEIVERVEAHNFQAVEHLYWRNRTLDFSSPEALLASLDRPSGDTLLVAHRDASDVLALRALLEDSGLMQAVRGRARVQRLWEICQLPDFRKTGEESHARLVKTLLTELIEPNARLSDAWMAVQLQRLEGADSHIDALQQKLSQVRTLAYIAHREDWCLNPTRWQDAARQIEDRLSDALHEALLSRFVDRRTNALIKGLKGEDALLAGVTAEGEVTVEGHFVGRLVGLTFSPDSRASTLEGRAVRQAALKALRPEIARRLGAIAAAPPEALHFGADALVRFQGAVVARLDVGAHWLSPRVSLMGAEDASEPSRARALAALQAALQAKTAQHLAGLMRLRGALAGKPNAETALSGLARGLAFALSEDGIAVSLADLPVPLSGAERRSLAEVGVKTGQRYAWLPSALGKAALEWRAQLGQIASEPRLAIPEAVPSSFSVDTPAVSGSFVSGFAPIRGYVRLASRAVRVDMVERLLTALTDAKRQAAASAFPLEAGLAALIGCKSEEFVKVIKALGLSVAQWDEVGKPLLWRFQRRARAADETPKQSQRRAKAQPPSASIAVRADSPFAVLADLPGLFVPPARSKSELPKPDKRTSRRRRRRSNSQGTQAAVSP